MNNSPSPPPSPAVTVLIVNWNGANFLPRCLDAVCAQTYPNAEVIVVDNASSDGSAQGIEARWPGVQVTRLDQNLGFAAGNNLGARLARGRWLALLNNDAFPAPDWLERLVQAAERHPEFSFFSSCMLQAHNPALVDAAGDVYHVSGLAWHRGSNLPLENTPRRAGEIFSPCAAAALYEREAFLEAGGFDERFSSHHEDVDLGFRLRLQGLRCLYVPKAVVEHLGSASFGKESHTTVYHVHRNLVWSYFANMPGWLVWRYLPAHLLANLIFLVYYSLRGQARTIWRAKRDALRGLPETLRRRKQIQAGRKVTPDEIRRVMDHGWVTPYVLGRRSEQVRKLARALGLDRS